jgi:solute carrier family 13 (sodium-dependent dicarboxylate transporter), member 2/3/5
VSDRARRRVLVAAGGPVLCGLALALAPADLPPPAARVLGLTLWMALWWVTEVVPLAATSLLPVVFLPLFGARTVGEATAPYASELVFLFLAGFLLAAALERWHTHIRIAFGLLGAIGTSGRRALLGVMLATALLSMWISNTATAAMMFPIAVAVGDLFGAGDPAGRIRTALLLGMAYAATIGGMATLIGSPPNVIVAGAVRDLAGRTIDFSHFMLLGVPIVVVLLPLTWLLLALWFVPAGGGLDAAGRTALADRRRSIGPLRGGEAMTLAIFVATAFAWFFRQPKHFGAWSLPGLTQLLPGLSDAGIGLAAAILLFALKGPTASGQRLPLLTWEEGRKLPWEVLLLFGGGLSLADAMESTGLSRWIGAGLTGLGGFPTPILYLGVAAVVVILGEFASNTAIAAMMMPLAAVLARAVGPPPAALMLVTGFACSLGFALPVATPPNAIAFGTGRVSMRDMVRVGLVLDLVGVVIVALLLSVLVPLVFPAS